MVPTGVEAIELAIQHQRDPGERMPVGGMAVGKRPGDPLRRQPVCHLRIFVYVLVVIEVDELVADRLAEDQSPTASSRKPQTANTW